MPEYISKFLEKGIRLLLRKKGQEFIEAYYDYIEKIYNYQIPLKMIASKGKIKKTLEEYVEDCKTITKAGRPKSRQAWMELALRENLTVNMGETIYYSGAFFGATQREMVPIGQNEHHVRGA